MLAVRSHPTGVDPSELRFGFGLNLAQCGEYSVVRIIFGSQVYYEMEGVGPVKQWLEILRCIPTLAQIAKVLPQC